MGNGQSRGSSDVHDKPEAPQVPEAPRVEAEAELGEQPATKSSSDTGKETVEAHSDEGNASQTIPQQEEVNNISPPAEEPGQQGPQENSQEVGQPPSLSETASSEKPPESDIAKPPVVEPSSEKAEDAIPHMPPEAAGEPDAEPGVVPLTTEGPSTDPELQPTAKSVHCLAEFIVQTKPCKITPCSPTKKNQCLGECGSFEVVIITEVTSEMVESDPSAAVETEQLEAQSSVEAGQTAEIAGADSKRAESAVLPTGETQVGHPAVDAQTTGGGQDQVKHADTKSISCVQDNGSFISSEAWRLGKEHPATATVHDPEAGPLPDHLAEPSTDVLQDSVKKMDETCSGSEAIEMAEVPASKLDEHPQTEHASSTGVTPAASETRPVATAEVHTQLQGSSGAHKDSMEGPVHTRKHGPKFATPFYLCCSDCSIGDGESNAE